MVQGGLKKVQGGLEPPLAPHFPRLWSLPCFASIMSYRILCPSFVCKLPHECEDMTKNAWTAPLIAQCNIKYRLLYSLFVTFLNYHRNRLFLYFLVNYRISIISLLFWVSIPNPRTSPPSTKFSRSKLHCHQRITHESQVYCYYFYYCCY